MKLCQDEESYYKQQSRVQWLQLGDKNTAFFHNSLMHLQSRNRIHRLTNEEGVTITDPQEIGKLVVSYYERLLTATPTALPEHITSIYPNTISDASRLIASLLIINEDIKNALFSIPDNKSPGPDGYNALFFKQSWSIIGNDFITVVRYFFSHNLLPRYVNATYVALVPKVENPASMNDFRPISFCNVLYKCISKLIVVRLKAALAKVNWFTQWPCIFLLFIYFILILFVAKHLLFFCSDFLSFILGYAPRNSIETFYLLIYSLTFPKKKVYL